MYVHLFDKINKSFSKEKPSNLHAFVYILCVLHVNECNISLILNITFIKSAQFSKVTCIISRKEHIMADEHVRTSIMHILLKKITFFTCHLKFCNIII